MSVKIELYVGLFHYPTLSFRVSEFLSFQFVLHFFFQFEFQQIHEDYITEENKKFVTEVVNDRFGMPAVIKGVQTYWMPGNDSLIEIKQVEKPNEWNKSQRRCGLITRKIGVAPMWRKDGTKISTTMLQVDDNHVIKYIEPTEYNPAQPPRVKNLQKFGCLLVGAGSANPSLFTKEYCGLFNDSGVMPKRHLGRFLITPNCKILPGLLDWLIKWQIST